MVVQAQAYTGLVITVLLLGCGQRHVGDQSREPASVTRVDRVLPEEAPGDDHVRLAERLVGKSHAEVREILERENTRYGYNSCWTYKDKTGFARHQLDCDTYLHLSYPNLKDKAGNIRDRDKVGSSKLANIEELRTAVPDGTFESTRFIHHSPTAGSFNPTSLIRAVNHLRHFGAEDAIRRLKIYHDLAVSEDLKPRWRYDLDEERLFLIVRLLFVRKDGDPRMPWMYLGSTIPSPSKDSLDWPLFPLAVCGDIPFFIADGYMLAGQPESPLRHIEYCRANCKIREALITPSMGPVQAIEQLYGTTEWKALFTAWKSQEELYPADARHKYSLRCQAMSCYPTNTGLSIDLPREFHPYCVGPKESERAWAETAKQLEHISLSWDASAQAFVTEAPTSNK